jgi:tripartite-type tricarboxylate transporter receptor subunit TctC
MIRGNLSRRRTLAVAGSALAAPMLASGIARAQGDWPNKTVRYINHFPPGGATDILSRVICQELSELTGQNFVVENKGGSGGNVGADLLAKSEPDGYTVGLYTIASHAIAPTLYARLPFNAEKDFTAVSTLWEVPNLLITKLDLNVKSVPELIELVKKSPGKYTFGSGGAGTSPHICGEMLKQKAGIQMLHVPYRGGAPALQDLLAGQIDMLYDNLPGVIAQVRAGKVQPLAVTTRQPAPQLPDIPPMIKFLPDFEISSWGGMCGPAGLPPAMVEKANALCKKALQNEKVKAIFTQQGATSLWNTPADSAKFRAANEARLAPIIKASGARVE